MKILYGIQGTGNGHLSRARSIVPILKEFAQVETVLSGTESQVAVDFEINYRYNGLPFLASKNGKVDIFKSIVKSHPIDLIRDIRRFPMAQYDLVISDFEPISSWSALLKGIPSIELSHNVAVASKESPKPYSNDKIGKYVLNHYCPSNLKFGFHFEKFNDKTFLPVIRNEVRNLTPVLDDYYVVYLPAYHDQYIAQVLSFFDVQWVVFSKYTKKSFQQKNIQFHPIENDHFLSQIESCRGVLCGAGFELPAEVMYLGKKLMVIPMRGQFEQLCNAHALKRLKVKSIPALDIAYYRTIHLWLQFESPVMVDYPDTLRNDLRKVLVDGVQLIQQNESVKPLTSLSLLRYFF